MSPSAGTNRVDRRPLAADWAGMTEEGQAQAVAIARHEGRRAAHWYFTAVSDSSRGGAVPPGCRRAQSRGTVDYQGDQLLHLYARAQSQPCEVDYFTFVVEPYCPERIAWWWRIPRGERLADPRICAFCDGYERERCRILGLPEPPPNSAGLEQYLRDTEARERASGRVWLAQTAASETEAAEEADGAAARGELLECLLATDLAHMLLAAAQYQEKLIGSESARRQQGRLE